MITIDQEIFDENLRLTQVYCYFQVNKSRDKNPAEILRGINPVYNGRPSFSFEQQDDYFQTEWLTDQLSPQGQSTYTEMFDFQMEVKRKFSKDEKLNFLSDGEILITSIDEVVTDGISEMESKGFIDFNDCTPIDTWFYMVYNQRNRILFSWIPRQFVHLVDEGMNVNLLATFDWYSENSSLLSENPWYTRGKDQNHRRYYDYGSIVKRIARFFRFQ